MSEYHPGDVVRLKTDPVFTNEDSEAEDPESVRLVYRWQGQPPTTLTYGTDEEVVRVGEGSYEVEFLLDREGKLFYRWESGPEGLTTADENSIEVASDF